MLTRSFVRRAIGLTGLACALVLAGCSQDDDLVQPRNEPPETTLQMQGPYDTPAGREILLEWSGADDRGEVSHFEVRLSRSDEDRLVDSWERTEERQRRIGFSTADLQNGELFFEFEVRAVDADGLRDPTAAWGTFSPRTQPPSARFDIPYTDSCVAVPLGSVLRWTASDPDSKHGPEATRYLILEVGGAADPCLTRTEYNADLPFYSIRTDDPRWSDWVDYDPDGPLHPSRSLPVEGLEIGHSYLIAVQARDEDGATSRRFSFNSSVAHVRITPDDEPPQLEVFEPLLGSAATAGIGHVVAYEVVAGGQLHFQWLARVGESTGAVDSYRYGRNLTDPDDPNDPGWDVAWGPHTDLVYDIAPQGAPNLVIQARSSSGQITRLVYQFQVVQRPEPSLRRGLLLVDDWRNQLGSSIGQELETEQDQAWTALLDAIVPGDWDVLDAQTDGAELGLEKVLGYRAVIWFVNASDLSYMHTRLGPTAYAAESYDWLEMAQKYAIPMMVVGPGAAWSRIEHPSLPFKFPLYFDVRNEEPHGRGRLRLPSGEFINRGTLRAPYRSFCVDIFSRVRPRSSGIYGEGSFPLRTLECDALLFADPSLELAARLPGVPSVVLRPTAARENLDPSLQLAAEEFYDRNVTLRSARPPWRACKSPMFRFRSRRGGDVGVDPASCPYPEEGSPLEGVPVALASFVYTDTRPEPARPIFCGASIPWAFGRRTCR